MAISSATFVTNLNTGGNTQAPPVADITAQKSTAGTTQVSQQPSPAHINQAIKQVNDAFAQNGKNLSASLAKDKATGLVVVKVTDNNTNEVVTQFPSKAIIAVAAAMTQSLNSKGNMLNIVG